MKRTYTFKLNKKFFLLILCLSFALSLAACSINVNIPEANSNSAAEEAIPPADYSVSENWAYLDEARGTLKVTDVDPEDYPPMLSILPEGAYHIYDYQFFFRNLEQNVADRLSKYMAENMPPAEEQYLSEGVDTKCVITGYNKVTGEEASYYLSKGDRVAVISPSALPSQSQVEACEKGIIFGEWTELPADGSGNFGKARGGKFESVADMIRREFLGDIQVPVAFGFPAGHGDVNYPLLMGKKVELSVSGSSYTLDWK